MDLDHILHMYEHLNQSISYLSIETSWYSVVQIDGPEC